MSEATSEIRIRWSPASQSVLPPTESKPNTRLFFFQPGDLTFPSTSSFPPSLFRNPSLPPVACLPHHQYFDFPPPIASLLHTQGSIPLPLSGHNFLAFDSNPGVPPTPQHARLRLSVPPPVHAIFTDCMIWFNLLYSVSFQIPSVFYTECSERLGAHL